MSTTAADDVLIERLQEWGVDIGERTFVAAWATTFATRLLPVNPKVRLLLSPHEERCHMAKARRRYSKKASQSVESAMRRRKRGSLRSGSGRKVSSRKQAIAIGLSEARRKGAKVPPKQTRGSTAGRKK